MLGRLDSRQPGVREARPVKIDNHPHEPSVLIGLEAQHIAFHHSPEALLLHNGAVPAGRDRARDRVVLEVQQVIRQAGVGAAQLGHPVILTMGLALAGEQLTERPGGTKTREVGGAQVLERGVEISEVHDMTAPGKPTVSYAYFKDPDGHGWALQKLPY